MTHICVNKLTTIGSDNGLSPGRRQAIIWTNGGIFLVGPLGTNFSEIFIGVEIFLLKKMHLNMSSAKWRPFCFGLNVLKRTHQDCVCGWWKHMLLWVMVRWHCTRKIWLNCGTKHPKNTRLYCLHWNPSRKKLWCDYSSHTKGGHAIKPKSD